MMLRMESPAPPIRVDRCLRGRPLHEVSGRASVDHGVFGSSVRAMCGGDAPPGAAAREANTADSDSLGVAAHERTELWKIRTKFDTWVTDKFSNLNDRIGFAYTQAEWASVGKTPISLLELLLRSSSTATAALPY